MDQRKIVATENSQRRNNICIIGVPKEQKAKTNETQLLFKMIIQEIFPETEKDLNPPTLKGLLATWEN